MRQVDGMKENALTRGDLAEKPRILIPKMAKALNI